MTRLEGLQVKATQHAGVCENGERLVATETTIANPLQVISGQDSGVLALAHAHHHERINKKFKQWGCMAQPAISSCSLEAQALLAHCFCTVVAMTQLAMPRGENAFPVNH